ncbi:MAG: FecR domain-containing protein, partial [Myxococcota bacterium]
AQADEPAIIARAGERYRAGARLRTEANSRAFVRFASAAGVLLDENASATFDEVDGAETVRLDRGRLVAAVTRRSVERALTVRVRDYVVYVVGTVFSVRADQLETVVEVSEGVVRVEGPTTKVRVAAGQCWSSSTRKVAACVTSHDAGLLKMLARHSDRQSYLRIEGPGSLAVQVDGYSLGRPPIQWWSPVGMHRIVGRDVDGELSGEVQVVHGRDTVFDLGRLRGRKTALLPAKELDEPPVEMLEKQTKRRLRSGPSKRKSVVTPTEPIEALRQQWAAATTEQERERLQYRLAVMLTRLGRYREAVQAFELVARARGTNEELALYELGRIHGRYLDDDQSAQQWLTAYRQRYPLGALRQEVSLTLIETMMSRHHYGPARAEMDAFMSAYPRSERRLEVLLMRGNVLRSQGKWAAALEDYEKVLAEVAGGRLADDALYYAAVCESEMGDAVSARERLEEYRDRFDRGRHRKEAEKALGAWGQK